MPVLETVPWTRPQGLLTRSDIPRRQWNRGIEARRPYDLLLADPGRSHNVTINPIKKSPPNIEPGASSIRSYPPHLTGPRPPVTFPLSPLNNLVMVYSVVPGALTTRTSLGMEWIACETRISPRHGVVGR